MLKQHKKNKIVKNIKKFFFKSQETFSIDILSKFLEKSKFFNVYRDFIDIFLPIFLVLIFGKTKAQKLIKYFRKNNRHRFSKPDELQKDQVSTESSNKEATPVITDYLTELIIESHLDSCNCKQQCINKKCPCVKNEKNCTEKCHNSLCCKNK